MSCRPPLAAMNVEKRGGLCFRVMVCRQEMIRTTMNLLILREVAEILPKRAKFTILKSRSLSSLCIDEEHF